MKTKHYFGILIERERVELSLRCFYIFDNIFNLFFILILLNILVILLFFIIFSSFICICVYIVFIHFYFSFSLSYFSTSSWTKWKWEMLTSAASWNKNWFMFRYYIYVQLSHFNRTSINSFTLIHVINTPSKCLRRLFMTVNPSREVCPEMKDRGQCLL